MGARVIEGCVFDVLPTLRPGSVDAVVCSPPYWKLRAYLSPLFADVGGGP